MLREGKFSLLQRRAPERLSNPKWTVLKKHTHTPIFKEEEIVNLRRSWKDTRGVGGGNGWKWCKYNIHAPNSKKKKKNRSNSLNKDLMKTRNARSWNADAFTRTILHNSPGQLHLSTGWICEFFNPQYFPTIYFKYSHQSGSSSHSFMKTQYPIDVFMMGPASLIQKTHDGPCLKFWGSDLEYLYIHNVLSSGWGLNWNQKCIWFLCLLLFTW